MVSQDPKTGESVFIHTPATPARQVFLAGSFNGWSATGRRMIKMKDGSYRARLRLEPGRHEYKFVVDGEWVCDPGAAAESRDACGAANSVAVITP